MHSWNTGKSNQISFLAILRWLNEPFRRNLIENNSRKLHFLLLVRRAQSKSILMILDVIAQINYLRNSPVFQHPQTVSQFKMINRPDLLSILPFFSIHNTCRLLYTIRFSFVITFTNLCTLSFTFFPLVFLPLDIRPRRLSQKKNLKNSNEPFANSRYKYFHIVSESLYFSFISSTHIEESTKMYIMNSRLHPRITDTFVNIILALHTRVFWRGRDSASSAKGFITLPYHVMFELLQRTRDWLERLVNSRVFVFPFVPSASREEIERERERERIILFLLNYQTIDLADNKGIIVIRKQYLH